MYNSDAAERLKAMAPEWSKAIEEHGGFLPMRHDGTICTSAGHDLKGDINAAPYCLMGEIHHGTGGYMDQCEGCSALSIRALNLAKEQYQAIEAARDEVSNNAEALYLEEAPAQRKADGEPPLSEEELSDLAREFGSEATQIPATDAIEQGFGPEDVDNMRDEVDALAEDIAEHMGKCGFWDGTEGRV